MPKVIIVGGGVHGTFLSHALTRSAALERDEITVIDPHPQPLAVWKHQTRNTGMSHLRSPSSHNMDIDFHALRNYARGKASTGGHGEIGGHADGADAFIAPYARPALSLFNEHAEATIEARRLTEMRRRGRVHEVEATQDGVLVSTETERYGADYVILAVGRTEMPHIPRWARAAEHPAVRHIFATDFSPDMLGQARAPVVIGGGVTAVQAACNAARRADTTVVMFARKSISVEQFDSAPCYIGPRCLQSFLATQTAAQRRRLIDAARRPGTVPWDVARALEEESRVTVTEDDIAEAEPHGEFVRLYPSNGSSPVDSDLVVLATGFERDVPLGGIVRHLAQQHGLPRGPLGYPMPDRYLRWHPRVLVSGSLAELELGPAAPNIIGAHLGARRLVPFFAAHDGRNGTAANRGLGDEIAWTALTHYVDSSDLGSPSDLTAPQ